jgi:hypothetical protein
MRLSKYLGIALGVAAVLLMGGCPPEDQKIDQDAPTVLLSVSSHVKGTNTGVIEDATAILKDVKIAKSGVEKVASEVNRPIINNVRDALSDIESRADQIIDGSKRIAEETAKLDKTLSDISNIEKRIIELKNELEEARKTALQKLHAYVTMFWVLGFIVITGGAIVSFLVNKTMGFTLIMVGALMIGFASASHYYLQEIAMIGGIIIIGTMLFGVGLLVWSMVNSKRTSTAVKEIVEMMEILKESMLDSEKERIFGTDGLASKVQSDITKEVIAKIKERNGFKRLAELRNAAAQSQQQQQPTPPPPTPPQT